MEKSRKSLKKHTDFIVFGESGQSIVEFVLILPILIILVLVPVDYFLYISTKMNLNNALCQGLSELNSTNVSKGALLSWIDDHYGTKLDMSKLELAMDITDKSTDYIYYVYDSEKANQHPQRYEEQFDARKANYTYIQVDAKISYQMQTITFIGKQFLGEDYTIETSKYSVDVYSN